MRVAVDTSILAYAEGVNDPEKKAAARSVLANLSHRQLILPVQAAAELFRVFTRKLRLDPVEAKRAVESWQSLFSEHPETSHSVLEQAFELAAAHRLQIFDAIIFAASARARCRLLLSEDMGDGFVWRGVTVVNPFAAAPHPLLADAMRG